MAQNRSDPRRGRPLRATGRPKLVSQADVFTVDDAGRLHSFDDQPALVRANGDVMWYAHGRKHRAGGLPAVIRANGDLEWKVDGLFERAGGSRPARLLHNGAMRVWYEGGDPTRVELDVPTALDASGVPLGVRTQVLTGPRAVEAVIDRIEAYEDDGPAKLFAPPWRRDDAGAVRIKTQDTIECALAPDSLVCTGGSRAGAGDDDDADTGGRVLYDRRTGTLVYESCEGCADLPRAVQACGTCALYTVTQQAGTRTCYVAAALNVLLAVPALRHYFVRQLNAVAADTDTVLAGVAAHAPTPRMALLRAVYRVVCHRGAGGTRLPSAHVPVLASAALERQLLQAVSADVGGFELQLLLAAARHLQVTVQQVPASMTPEGNDGVGAAPDVLLRADDATAASAVPPVVLFNGRQYTLASALLTTSGHHAVAGLLCSVAGKAAAQPCVHDPHGHAAAVDWRGPLEECARDTPRCRSDPTTLAVRTCVYVAAAFQRRFGPPVPCDVYQASGVNPAHIVPERFPHLTKLAAADPTAAGADLLESGTVLCRGGEDLAVPVGVHDAALLLPDTHHLVFAGTAVFGAEGMTAPIKSRDLQDRVKRQRIADAKLAWERIAAHEQAVMRAHDEAVALAEL